MLEKVKNFITGKKERVRVIFRNDKDSVDYTRIAKSPYLSTKDVICFLDDDKSLHHHPIGTIHDIRIIPEEDD